jgi:hypothetical protein
LISVVLYFSSVTRRCYLSPQFRAVVASADFCALRSLVVSSPAIASLDRRVLNELTAFTRFHFEYSAAFAVGLKLYLRECLG